MPNGMEQPVSEREKWEAEIRLREKEIAARSGWSSPLVIAVLLVAFALLANAGLMLQSRLQSRAQADRILEAIRLGSAARTTDSPYSRPLNSRPDLADKWFRVRSDYIFPSRDTSNEDGCLKPAREMTLTVGTVIDRYGAPSGAFLAPVDTPYEARALPYEKAMMPYYRYEVVKELKVQGCQAVPWFDQSGGGTQYKTDNPVQKLVTDGFLKDVSGR